MRKIIFSRLALPVLLLAAAGLFAADEKATTWEGTLVDGHCYLKDRSSSGADHKGMKQCGKFCLQAGNPAGLLTKDGKFYVLIARSPVLAPYTGQVIRVTGPLTNGAILAEKVEVNKDGKWQAIPLGM